MLPEPTILQIERETVERYTLRLRELGDVPRALGWANERSQQVRFDAFLAAQAFEGRHVLDVGCGFGDFYAHMKSLGVHPASYTGWDVNPELLTVARRRHPEATFAVRNVLREPTSSPTADVIVAMGVLNFRLDALPNPDYATAFLEALWPATREALLVDMLSAHRTPEYPAEEHVYYYSPEEMFGRATRLTTALAIKHDYPPIPQREFILRLGREDVPTA